MALKSLVTRFRRRPDEILPILRPYYFLAHFPGEHFKAAPIQALQAVKSALMLRPLVAELAPHCRKIVLFGSRGHGTNRPNSDIDLFLITTLPEEVKAKARKIGLNLPAPLDLTINSPTQAAQIQHNDPQFWTKLSGGIVLWLAPRQEATAQSRRHN